MKMKSIKIGEGMLAGQPVNRVVMIKNSPEYRPGQFISNAEVQSLCENPDWDVVRVPMKEHS
jgi:hypothetical protein